MPYFDYTASDRTGSISKGQVEAKDKAGASRGLAARGLFVLEIKSAPAAAVAPPTPAPEPIRADKSTATTPAAKPTSTSQTQADSRFAPWSRMDRALYLRQMEVMFGAGIPLHRATRVLSEGNQYKPAACAKLQAIPDDLERGRTLSRALLRSGLFSSLIISAVRLGEESGRLEAILRSLSGNEEQSVKLARSIVSRLTYPLVVMAVMCAGLVVLGHVMGRVMAALPALRDSSNPIFGLVTGLFTHWAFLPVALTALVAVTALGRLLWQNQSVRMRLERRLLGLAIVGPLLRRVEASSVTSHLALLVRSGLALDRGLGLCSELVHTLCFREALLAAQGSLRNGDELGSSFRSSGLFPEDVLALISAGEVSGNLESSLETAARYCSDQVERTLDTALSILEPLLIGLLGIAIGSILLFTFVPVFNSLNTL